LMSDFAEGVGASESGYNRAIINFALDA